MPLFSLLICASLQAVEANRAFDSKSESIFKHLVGSSITLRGVAERVEAVGGGREIVLADSKVRIRIPAEVLAANAGAFRDLDRLVGKEIFAHGGVVERDGDLLLEILVPAEIAGSAAELDESKFFIP